MHNLHVVAESMSPSAPCTLLLPYDFVLSVIIVLSSMYKHSMYIIIIVYIQKNIVCCTNQHEHTNDIALHTHINNIHRSKYVCSSEHST